MSRGTEETPEAPATADGLGDPAARSDGVALPHASPDGDGRVVDFRPYEPSDRAAVRSFYESFGSADRSQGVPPAAPSALDEWLSTVTAAPSVVATHDDRVIGHVTFVPDRSGEHELGLFVAPEHRRAGVGTGLLRTGLGHARRSEVSAVWLSVERGNETARRLFRRAGFVETNETVFTVHATRSID
ncbi:MAG: sortase related acyltransferase [halophilic archaeon J07HB67]|nr:MAG: sortase related acyltransferase [halophilic archaeon J07HB67]